MSDVILESTPHSEPLAELSPAQLSYLSSLSSVVGVLQDNIGLNNGWYVIGGLPIDAYTDNSSFTIGNAEKGIRDIDILTYQSNIPNFHLARRLNPTPIQIDITYHAILHLGEDKAQLKLGKYLEDLDPSIFATRIVSLGGVEFPTFNPNTLLHLYAIGIVIHGSLREKDFRNALRLARYTKENGLYDRKAADLYQPFHTFLKKSGYKDNLLLNALRMYRRSGLQRYIHPDNPTLQPFMEFIWKLTN